MRLACGSQLPRLVSGQDVRDVWVVVTQAQVCDSANSDSQSAFVCRRIELINSLFAWLSRTYLHPVIQIDFLSTSPACTTQPQRLDRGSSKKLCYLPAFKCHSRTSTPFISSHNTKIISPMDPMLTAITYSSARSGNIRAPKLFNR